VKRVVVKVGGHALDCLKPDAPVLTDLAQDVAELRSVGTDTVIVHGGGPQIADLLSGLGRTETFHEGLRVTDEDTMPAVAMALSLVNVQIVAAFTRAGVRAVGLAGSDDGLLSATALGATWGRVGGVPTVRTALLTSLWSLGITPIVSPIATDAASSLLNVNADTVAGALAAALDADALVMLSDVDQVRTDPDDPTSGVTRLTRHEATSMLESDRAREGMRPKIRAALDALNGGAGSVTMSNGARPHALRDTLAGVAVVTEVVA
jgi:acetylglutamate kinase